MSPPQGPLETHCPSALRSPEQARAEITERIVALDKLARDNGRQCFHIIHLADLKIDHDKRGLRNRDEDENLGVDENWRKHMRKCQTMGA